MQQVKHIQNYFSKNKKWTQKQVQSKPQISVHSAHRFNQVEQTHTKGIKNLIILQNILEMECIQTVCYLEKWR